jgi:Zn-finger protein
MATYKKNIKRIIQRDRLLKKLEAYESNGMQDSDKAQKLSHEIRILDNKIDEATSTSTCKIVHELEATNKKLIAKLNGYAKWDALNCEDAKKKFKQYKETHDRYLTVTGYKLTETFNPNDIKKEKLHIIPISNQRSCQVCGFPLTKTLDVHHLIPQNSEAKTGHMIKVCRNCHKIIHRCGNLGYIEDEIMDYYASLDGAIEMLCLCTTIIWDIEGCGIEKPLVSHELS